MASDISPRAEIDPRAQIGDNCKIFPFVYIEGDVVIGDNCIIFPFTSILNGSRIGKSNKIHQGSVIAALPQDFEFHGEKSECVIGDNNIIRENVVINRATHTGGQTVIGNNNFLMEGVHISHDTKIGDNCVFGYGTKIAGDCVIGDKVIFSTSVIENAGTKVGRGTMIQAGTTFSKDIPPYIIAGGTPVKYNGVNTVVLSQNGVGEKVQKHLANAYRLVFHGQNSVVDAINQVKEQVPDSEEIRNVVAFLEESTRGIITKL
jgi:UDP-N-acetylglucosamine acyltransferase